MNDEEKQKKRDLEGRKMKLLKVEIPKSKLDMIPEKEVVFFVQCGNMLNDISMLQKLSIFSMNFDKPTDTERTAQILQTMGLLRLQAGKLKEGWELLQNHFFAAKVSKQYDPLFNEKEQKALKSLTTYFGRPNIIFQIRKEFAFHYPSKDTIVKALKAMPDSVVFEVFMSEHFANCVFSLSNTLTTLSILSSTKCSDGQRAMNKWVKEIPQVSRCFGEFLGGCLRVFAQRHSAGFKSSEVEIPEPPDVNEVTLPYFIKGKKKKRNY